MKPKAFRKGSRLTVLLLILTFFLGSCAAPLVIRRISCSGKGDENAVASLKKGQTKEEVMSTMGSPYSREVYQLPSGDEVEFLFYPQIDDDGKPDTTALVPVAFRDGILVSWECSYYDEIVNSSQKIR